MQRWVLWLLCTMVCLLAGTGCVGSLETARADGLARASSAPLARSSADRGECVRLDRKRARWAAVAAGAGILAGGTGLVTIPAEDETTRVGLIAGSVAALAIAGSAEVVSQQVAREWAEECTGGAP
jgi:hypothetical protein